MIIGKRMRLTTKPGESVTVIGVLPTASANAARRGDVPSLVCPPRDDLDQRHQPARG